MPGAAGSPHGAEPTRQSGTRPGLVRSDESGELGRLDGCEPTECPQQHDSPLQRAHLHSVACGADGDGAVERVSAARRPGTYMSAAATAETVQANRAWLKTEPISISRMPANR